jgi:hypothetical protein
MPPRARRRTWLIATCVVAALACAATVEAQFGLRSFFGPRLAVPDDFDGRWHFCRAVYQSGFGRGGGGWTTDYPDADINLSIRLSELTRTDVSAQPNGYPNHLLVELDSDELFQCPFLLMASPNRVLLSPLEAQSLREYLLKGGFLWVDDFWGTFAWQDWEAQIRKVFPANERPIIELPMDHPLFRTQFEVTEVPQIPNVNFWLRTGGLTSEQGLDSATPHARAITDDHDRVMVLMTHNTDISDSWEREATDPRYFYAVGPQGYAFGINAVLYTMMH